MKPHNQATWSFGKLALLVVGLVAAAGMSGALGDGSTPPPDLSRIGRMFDVKDAGPEPAKEPAKKGGTPKSRRMCPDDPENCWWQ